MRLSFLFLRKIFKGTARFVRPQCTALLLIFLSTACTTTSGNAPPKGTYPRQPNAPMAGGGPAAAPLAQISSSSLPSTYTPPAGAVPVPAQAGLSATPIPAPASPKPVSRPKPAAAHGALPAPDGVDKSWHPLMERLRNDPNAGPELAEYFCNLPGYSPMPMGVKVKELFTNAFMRKPPTGKPVTPPSRIYRNVVTAPNVAKCNAFLTQYKDTFAAVEKKYPIPKEILVSLLHVETRLGNNIGKENAFWSLACMAAADNRDKVKDGLEGIPITDQHSAWLQAKLTDKSDWAYKELRALLKYCNVQQLDPRGMPGSVYGAIGICQFMPSNLVPYGDDGDGDGVVNLFSVPDAIFSAALYLTKHGWKKGMSVEKQRAVLKRYNNLNIYANTILAMGESIRTGVLQTGPPDSVLTAAKATAKGAGGQPKAAKKAKAGSKK